MLTNLSNVQATAYGLTHWRIFETPEVDIIGIFVFLKYDNELELVTSDISFNSVCLSRLDKSKFVFKFIWLATISNLFPFEISQKCQ